MESKDFPELNKYLKPDYQKDKRSLMNDDTLIRQENNPFRPQTMDFLKTPCSINSVPCNSQNTQNCTKDSPNSQSFESYLHLPQLPVDGDDTDEKKWLFPHKCTLSQQNCNQMPSFTHDEKRLPSSLRSDTAPCITSSSSGIRSLGVSNHLVTFIGQKYKNCHKTIDDKPSYATASTKTRSQQHSCNISSKSHVCGNGKPSDSLFPFIATNDTVMATASVNSINDTDVSSNVVANENPLQKFSSSTSILIKNTNACNNSHHNNSSTTAKPFSLAANYYYHEEKLSHPHHTNYSHYRQFARRRWLLFRLCQAVCLLFCVIFLINLVRTLLRTNDEYPSSPASVLHKPSQSTSFAVQNRLIQSWNMPSPFGSTYSTSAKVPVVPEVLSVISSHSRQNHGDEHDDSRLRVSSDLLGIPNFRFLMNNKTKCNIPRDGNNYFPVGGEMDVINANNEKDIGPRSGDASTIFFMIIVHSAPRNFEERQAIRETWGSLQRLGQFHIRLVFLLGHELNSDDYDNTKNDHNNNYKSNKDISIKNDGNFVGDEDADKMTSGSVERRQSASHLKIQQESQLHGDIVTGNFHDSYRNLTYKHLMGYLWVLNHCSQAKYVLKADDDAFIDIFQLFKFVLRTFGKDPEPALICNVFPEGTKPVRGSDSMGKKWAVTYEEYPYDKYPKYCGGLAYLVTPSVIREIYSKSQNQKDKYLWIDDVFVTGILREKAHVEPFYLNLRYSYEPEDYRKWLAMAESVKKKREWGEVGKKDSYKSSKKNISYSDSATSDAVWEGQTSLLSNQINNNDERFSLPIKMPFMIIHMERGSELRKEMINLWNKTASRSLTN